MTPGWKEVAKAFGFVLLFGILAYNLYMGADLLTSIFRGIVAWLVFQILNIMLTNILVRQLSEYEYKRLRKLAEEEEMEELRQAQSDEEYEEELTTDADTARGKGAQAGSAPKAAAQANHGPEESGETGSGDSG